MTAFRDGPRTENGIEEDPASSAPSCFHACLMFNGKNAGFRDREALDPALLVV